MNKKQLLALFLAISLLLPAIFGIGKVKAAYPSFTIAEVKTDQSVTINTKDMPKNLDFKVLLGEYNTKGKDGIEVATFNSGDGGAFAVTVNIADALKGRAIISIRIESLTGGYYYYNWFWNKQDGGTWPDQTATTQPSTQTPAPTQAPADKTVPTISIKAVEAGKTVTIAAKDFPKGVEFVALMGKMWTQGIKGIESGQITSSDTGSFEATFDIPAELANEKQISIRLQAKTGGWYSYNWFYNQTQTAATETPTTEPTTAPTQQPPAVKYPVFSIAAVEKDKTVTIEGKDFPADTEFTVLMGKMWTQGINGIEAGTFASGKGGEISATFDIPAELVGLARISIRLQAKTGGWYAYNWYWNSTANK